MIIEKSEKRKNKNTNKNNPNQNGSDYFCLVQAVGLEPTLFRTCP